MFGVESRTTYDLYFNTKHKKTFIGIISVIRTTGTFPLPIDPINADAPFLSRAKGFLNLDGGNGTLELIINDVEYSDNGIVNVQHFLGRTLLSEENTTLVINGMLYLHIIILQNLNNS